MRTGKIPVQTPLGAWPGFGIQPCCTRLQKHCCTVSFKSSKNNKKWLTLDYWGLPSTLTQSWPCGSKIAVPNSMYSGKALLEILKNQMWCNSLENFYHLINTVSRYSKKLKHVLHIHFVVLKKCMVYVHTKISKVPCFVCLPNCYAIGIKYFKH